MQEGTHVLPERLIPDCRKSKFRNPGASPRLPRNDGLYSSATTSWNLVYSSRKRPCGETLVMSL
jgi:hypothetical protein